MSLVENKAAEEAEVADSGHPLVEVGKRAEDVLPEEGEVPMPALEDAEEFDFDPFAGVEGEAPRAPRWYAMALYYSSQRSRGIFDEMGAAWRLAEPIPVRALGDNRFILEFAVEEEYNFVIKGGPWHHKGDAVIVVPYDGLADRPSVLAKKLSDHVLEIGGPVSDFLRARVKLPLDAPLKPFVEAMVKKMGLLLFEVKYENVPWFCIICGRMGHSKRDCTEEEDEEEEGGEGDIPRKKNKMFGCRKNYYCACRKAARSHAASSATNDMGGWRKGMPARSAPLQLGGGSTSNRGLKRLPEEVSNALTSSVQKMAVDDKALSASRQEDSRQWAHVSGLNTFVDSSDRSQSGTKVELTLVRMERDDRQLDQD
ncbi:hypothetical protein C2845_PM05G17180 [Panicum miliaceum]|uniref:CCHC-type domain-containing protein n=1 Tax=Panicum miliaceum TaxID=4540 RepID=A0A3L6T002_PANMI|nr:hypothetical protein C2845_PM05G17180 [Panicum miliaceum]